MDDASFPSGELYGDSPKKSRTFLRILILFIIIVALGFAAVSFFGNPLKKSAKPTPTPTGVPTETPLPTASASATPTGPTGKPTTTPKPTITSSSSSIDKATGLDRSALAVEIQNGSGAPGVGAKASDFLSALGYKIASTGNADNFNFQNVSISVKPSASKFLPLLKSDLAKQYTIGSTSAALSSSTADALVIIGK